MAFPHCHSPHSCWVKFHGHKNQHSCSASLVDQHPKELQLETGRQPGIKVLEPEDFYAVNMLIKGGGINARKSMTRVISMAFHGFFWCYQVCIGSIGDGNVMHLNCTQECQMAEIPKSSKGSFKNEVFKRSSSGTRDKNVCKQQKREDYPVQMLPAMRSALSKPCAFRDFKSIGQNFFNNKLATNQEQEFVAGASGVDAENGSGSFNDPSVEISQKEKSLKAAHKLDLNSTLPDLNEAALPELMSVKDVDDGSNSQDGPSFVANDLLEAVQVVRKLEIEGHISGIFRMKFLSFLGLKATAKERDVVRTFIQTMGDDPRCLAGQLIDSFSGVVNMKA